MKNEELLCSIMAQAILHSSFFILNFKRNEAYHYIGRRNGRLASEVIRGQDAPAICEDALYG